MKIALLFILCLPGMVYCNSGVYFTRENYIYAAFGSWIITFTVDLRPYKYHLTHMYKEVGEFETIAVDLNDKSHSQKLPEAFRKQFTVLANSTKGLVPAEIQHFKQEYREVLKVWQSVEVLL